MDMIKLLEKLPPGYAEDVAVYSDEDVRGELVQCEANIHQVETEKAADEKLAGAKAIVKDLSAPYRDAISAQRAKIKYLLALLMERGKLPEGEGLREDRD
jgi:hypothetical protein